MPAFNERNEPSTQINEWEIALISQSNRIICEKSDNPSISLDVSCLRATPAELNLLQSLILQLALLLELDTAQINQLTDWIRVNFDQKMETAASE